VFSHKTNGKTSQKFVFKMNSVKFLSFIYFFLNFLTLIYSDCDIESLKRDCYSQITKKWPLTNESNQSPHRICCWHWDVFDCVEVAACQSCAQDQEIIIENQYNKEKQKLMNGTCQQYPYGSIKCHYPTWFYAMIFSGTCLIIAVTYLIFTYCKRMKTLKKFK